MLIRPPKLQSGQTIGIIAPASPPPDPKNVDRAVANLERLGFKVKLAPNVHKRHGFLAGSDRERASDLMRMFTDPRVAGIICVRGGYGAGRLLPLLDYRAIRDNAKVFVGYSDITSFHCAFLAQSNLVSFHGPMLNSDFAEAAMPDFTRQSFLRSIAPEIAASDKKAPNPKPTGISHGYAGKTVKILRRGKVRGPLVGGNLTVFCTTIGTPWLPKLKGSIFFLEDVGEQPYRIDRMLTQLLNCGLLQQVAGIAIGVNNDCEDPRNKKSGEYRQSLEDVFRDRLLPLKIPVVMGLPFGHVTLNATLPVGAEVILDADRGELFIPKSGVV